MGLLSFIKEAGEKLFKNEAQASNPAAAPADVAALNRDCPLGAKTVNFVAF